MAEPICYYCDRPAEAECPACGRIYCAEHGDEVCLRCMAPETAVPAAMVYRGSLAALVVGSLVAIFLLVRPPASEGPGEVVRAVDTPTPAFSATATPTPEQERTPSPTQVEEPSPTTAGSSPSATPTPDDGTRTYVVQEGDFLSTIAQEFGTTVEAILELNPDIDPETLPIGYELTIPAPDDE